ncbi:MAG: DUF86 domain-containing protein [bacterium]|nr:DUF86 domain-containing protein [bacterium]
MKRKKNRTEKNIRLDIVEERIQKLEEYINYLEKLSKYSCKELGIDFTKFWAVERGLQVAIESIFDIGNYLIATLNFERPTEYRDILFILAKHKIIPHAFAKKLNGIAGFRNILVHEYFDINLNLVYAKLQKAPQQFRQFVKYIVRFLVIQKKKVR